jgi:uncharacterized protein
MLLQLTIDNFLSFKDEVTLSMRAVSSDQQHPHHLLQWSGKQGIPVLGLAAIYGANGAGKSNLIKAVSFAKDLVVRGTRGTKGISVSPFKFGGDGDSPSKFEFIFTYQGSQYSYGFKLDRHQILEEWLYATPEGKKKELMYFERITTAKHITTVEYGPSLKKRSEKRRQFLDFVAEGTRPNQLFLTEAIDRNVQELTPVMNWFKRALTIIPAEANYNNLEIDLITDESFTEFMSDFLRHSGTGIDSVIAEEIELDLDHHFRDAPESLVKDLADAECGSAVMLKDPKQGRFMILKDAEQQLKLVYLKTRHRNVEGHFVDLNMNEESDGTQHLINLAPALFLLKVEPEIVLLIDELDRRLHPLLSRHFLNIAISCRRDDNQLIFTTHDTNLLDLELLRRDEIWFIEKAQGGSSGLYSLAEFKIRPELKVEKGYLNGRFGAIPFFGDPKHLGWLQSSTEATCANA